MKESTWFKNYEAEVKSKRDKSNKNKVIVIPIVLGFMAVLCCILAMVNGNNAAAEQQVSPIFYFLPVFAFIALLTVMMLAVSKRKDPANRTRNSLKELLRSDGEVDAFDLQMSEAPVMELETNRTTRIFLTQDYVGSRFLADGDVTYTFIRKGDIASFNFKKTASTTDNPLNAAFFFDIKNSDGKVILNGLTDSGKQLDALMELIRTAQPAVSVSER